MDTPNSSSLNVVPIMFNSGVVQSQTLNITTTKTDVALNPNGRSLRIDCSGGEVYIKFSTTSSPTVSTSDNTRDEHLSDGASVDLGIRSNYYMSIISPSTAKVTFAVRS